MGCCKGFAKIILFICNVSYLVSGLVLVGVGAATLLEPDYIIRLLEKQLPVVSNISDEVDLERLVTRSGIVLIVLGTIVAAAAAIGCYGACAENKTILVVYMVTLSIFLLAEVALVIFAADYPNKYKGNLRDKMQKSLGGFKEDVALLSNGTMRMPTDPVSLSWTFLQFGGGCCGTNNYTDYRNWTHSVSIKGISRSTVVPVSCCLKTKYINLRNSTNYDDSTFVNLNGCLGGNKIDINEKGCHGVTYDLIMKLGTIGIGCICGAIIQQLLLIIFAIVMCRHNGKYAT